VEISLTRDSHVPTTDPRGLNKKEEEEQMAINPPFVSIAAPFRW
jgi:hypothetical protein